MFLAELIDLVNIITRSLNKHITILDYRIVLHGLHHSMLQVGFYGYLNILGSVELGNVSTAY
jgi:hypothetical protein